MISQSSNEYRSLNLAENIGMKSTSYDMITKLIELKWSLADISDETALT